MPNTDPNVTTGAEKVALASEDMSAAAKELVTDAMKEVLGEERAEQWKEMQACVREIAEAVKNGQPDKAPEMDPENKFAWEAKEYFQDLMLRGVGEKVDKAAPSKSMLTLGKALIAAGATKMNPDAASKMLEETGMVKSQSELELAKGFLGLQKAANVSQFVSGGALQSTSLDASVIPELLPQTFLANEQSVPRLTIQAGGTHEMAYVDDGVDPEFVEESEAPNASQPDFDRLSLTPRKLIAVVPFSYEFANGTVGGGEQLLASIAQRSMTDTMDDELLRGDGSSSGIRGLRYLVDSGNIDTVNATVSAANTIADLNQLIALVVAGDVPFTPAVARWAIGVRTAKYLRGLQDNSAGGFIFRNDMDNLGRIFGIPMAGDHRYGLSRIPENLSYTGSNESENYLYTTDGLVFGTNPQSVRIDMSGEAAYVNSAGTTVSAWSRDETSLRIIMTWDMNSIYRGKNIAIHPDVDWGA